MTPLVEHIRQRDALYRAATAPSLTVEDESAVEHLRNALAILVLSHDADDVEAAVARLRKALRALSRPA